MIGIAIMVIPGASAFSDPTPPGAPLALVAYPVEEGTFLTWEPPIEEGSDPLQGYHIYRFNGTDRDYVAFVASGTEEFLDETADNSTSYVYIATAANAAGESPPSNPAVRPDWPWCQVVWIDDEDPFVHTAINCLFPIPIIGDPPVTIGGGTN